MYFNCYGYIYVRLYWTGFGLPVNLVEEHIQLSIVLHIIVGLQRTWDIKLALDKVWNSACSTWPWEWPSMVMYGIGGRCMLMNSHGSGCTWSSMASVAGACS